jgi:hypothetical protein
MAIRAVFATNLLLVPCFLAVRLKRWRQYAPPKRQTVSELQGITIYNMALFMVTALRGSDPSVHRNVTWKSFE